MIDKDSHAIFISKNIKDFADPNETSRFHPDFYDIPDTEKLNFRRHLPDALLLGDEILMQIEEYYLYLARKDLQLYYYKSPYCQDYPEFIPYGFLDERIEVRYASGLTIDPYQLSFEGFSKPGSKRSTTVYGTCGACDTLHILSLICDSLIPVDDIENIQSDECETSMRLHLFYEAYDNHLFVDDLITENNEPY